MKKSIEIAVPVGSLRKASLNRMVANVLVCVSPGAIGGFGANHHLRQSLVFLNVPVMPQPEAYIDHADKPFDPNGRLTNQDTRKFLNVFLQSFGAWIAANTKPAALRS